MRLPEEIKLAAEKLGKELGADPGVQELTSLLEQLKQEPEIVELENNLDQCYQNLIDRQANGEILDRAELDEYYTLKRRVQNHPLVAAREVQLEMVKALFVQTAQRMTSILGIDYPNFAR